MWCMVSDALVDGGKGAAAGLAGMTILGPTIGPALAGFAADEFLGGSVPWLPIGAAMSIASLIPMGSSSSAAGSRGTL